MSSPKPTLLGIYSAVIYLYGVYPVPIYLPYYFYLFDERLMILGAVGPGGGKSQVCRKPHSRHLEPERNGRTIRSPASTSTLYF